jgi:uncharacterized protein YhaN
LARHCVSPFDREDWVPENNSETTKWQELGNLIQSCGREVKEIEEMRRKIDSEMEEELKKIEAESVDLKNQIERSERKCWQEHKKAMDEIDRTHGDIERKNRFTAKRRCTFLLSLPCLPTYCPRGEFFWTSLFLFSQ